MSALALGSGVSHVRIRRYSSKRFPEKIYKTTDEFWRDHFDPVGDNIAKLVEHRGYVLKKKCYLEPNGKVLVQEKHYPSKAHFETSEHVRVGIRATAPDYLFELSVEERSIS